MEKGLWCYEANVAEPARLNAASAASLPRGPRQQELLHYYAAYHRTQHTGTV